MLTKSAGNEEDVGKNHCHRPEHCATEEEHAHEQWCLVGLDDIDDSKDKEDNGHDKANDQVDGKLDHEVDHVGHQALQPTIVSEVRGFAGSYANESG